MANPSYTYTLTNGTTADASQVMQNFNDILNGVTDGTKDMSVSALTVAGTATLNGNINLGNASGDDLTITASLASTVPVKTNNSFNIGSATLGLAGVYFGNAGLGLTARVVSASHATARTYTIPDCSAAASFLMSESAQSKNGVLTFNDGIQVDDAAGQSVLSYYRTATNTGTLTGATTSPTISAEITRVGNIVVFKVKTFTVVTKDASAGFLTVANLVPSWAAPSANTRLVATTRVAGNDGAGLVLVTTGLDWSMGNNGGAGSFGNIAANATNCGLPYDITMSWVID